MVEGWASGRVSKLRWSRMSTQINANVYLMRIILSLECLEVA
jgi:hypothetical protein